MREITPRVLQFLWNEMAMSLSSLMWQSSLEHIWPLLPTLHPWVWLLQRPVFGLVISSLPLQWFLPPPTLFPLQRVILPRHSLDPQISPSYHCQWDTLFKLMNMPIPTPLELSFNSIAFFVGSWLFCMQNFPCSISFQCMFGVVWKFEQWTHYIASLRSKFI